MGMELSYPNSPCSCPYFYCPSLRFSRATSFPLTLLGAIYIQLMTLVLTASHCSSVSQGPGWILLLQQLICTDKLVMEWIQMATWFNQMQHENDRDQGFRSGVRTPTSAGRWSFGPMGIPCCSTGSSSEHSHFHTRFWHAEQFYLCQ